VAENAVTFMIFGTKGLVTKDNDFQALDMCVMDFAARYSEQSKR
jgi:hypothetical protein